ncbi:MAG: hypothetical protein OZSIB_1152 [Candidatus Ozemobacter sibiricus]|uniref:Tetratricopeptide repeat protein n=1 Tax=Candidatus Ozemobacter sibiricus TaxID=2268124 RepID=A0A367ZM19_9BACT|nr:MAG: hypothetical protein OZSIB_1152 [Candidatus Ozemobacter sibiricus]
MPTIKPPYEFKTLLTRAEELFKENNYREALIFYYEALRATTTDSVRSRIHFRIGECLEGIRRFDFAEYHYKQALLGELPDSLASRVAIKLKHLPKLAQHEEATRLFKRAMAAYKRRDIRGALDDYLRSLQLEPSLMGQDDSGLIDDAIQYLTYLTEDKAREPGRLLKLATFQELRGDTEKAIETLKQILIIYPNSEEAGEAEEKLTFYTQKRTSYVEFRRPRDGLADLQPRDDAPLHEVSLEFRDPGVQSKELGEFAYTFRAFNEQPNVPDHRFEQFSMVLGKGANQKEYLYRAEEGIPDRKVTYEDGAVVYRVEFQTVNLTTAYVQDIYGEGVRSVPLFASIQIKLTITRR